MDKKDTQKANEAAGLGFGTRQAKDHSRFLNKDGTVNIRRLDGDLFRRIDFFHSMITMPWKRFLLMVLVGYLIINLVFASLYMLAGPQFFGNLNHASPRHEFLELFFFSAQTITTVGYGYIYPNGPIVSTIAAIESMMGLLLFALATGVLYGRFSRPKASIRYSKNCLISPYENQTGFMFRVANATQNELIEVEAKVILSLIDPKTGQRDFITLPLEIEKLSFMPLSWTIVHPVDEKSPIYNFNKEDFIKADCEFLILIKATNDTYSQLVYSRNSYKGNELILGSKFVPMKRSRQKSRTTIDLRRLDAVEYLGQTENKPNAATQAAAHSN